MDNLTFVEKNRDVNVLYGGQLTLSVIDFVYFGDFNHNENNIIHQFINYNDDFDIAYKIANGMPREHLDKFVVNNVFKVQNFGPYKRSLLVKNDYYKTTYNHMINKIDEMIFDGEYIYNKAVNFRNKIIKILTVFNNSYNIYLLNPSNDKVEEFTTFKINFYNCFFCINPSRNEMSVIQIDDDQFLYNI